jgi:hypothetical protein
MNTNMNTPIPTSIHILMEIRHTTMNTGMCIHMSMLMSTPTRTDMMGKQRITGMNMGTTTDLMITRMRITKRIPMTISINR